MKHLKVVESYFLVLYFGTVSYYYINQEQILSY